MTLDVSGGFTVFIYIFIPRTRLLFCVFCQNPSTRTLDFKFIEDTRLDWVGGWWRVWHQVIYRPRRVTNYLSLVGVFIRSLYFGVTFSSTSSAVYFWKSSLSPSQIYLSRDIRVFYNICTRVIISLYSSSFFYKVISLPFLSLSLLFTLLSLVLSLPFVLIGNTSTFHVTFNVLSY